MMLHGTLAYHVPETTELTMSEAKPFLPYVGFAGYLVTVVTKFINLPVRPKKTVPQHVKG